MNSPLSSSLSNPLTCRLGIVCTSIGHQIWKILSLCSIYFLLSLWDTYESTFSNSTQVNLCCVIPVSITDAVIYFWIFQCLFRTIQELSEKKQSGKLIVFTRLRNILISVIVLSSLYNLSFSYIFLKRLEELWKVQWFFYQGVWCCFYFFIICSITVGSFKPLLIYRYCGHQMNDLWTMPIITRLLLTKITWNMQL